MAETKVGEVDTTAQLSGPVSLAFRVKAHGDNLFSAEVLLLEGDKVMEKRHGAGTTLGHAIAAADDLMDGWAFDEIARKPEDFFRDIIL